MNTLFMFYNCKKNSTKTVTVAEIACAKYTYKSLGYYKNDTHNSTTRGNARKYCNSVGGYLPHNNMRTHEDRKYEMI